ncbi:MAG: hypothetical protein WDA75_20505, partial [Candidatus Latescibacterota bacterium]
AEFQAPRDQQAELWVGSDEPLTVWVNGEEVYRYQRTRQHKLPNDRPPITVRQGRNTLLVEVVQRWRDFDFSLNICEPEEDERFDGNRVAGLRFTTPGEEAAVSAAGSNVMADEEPFEIVGWHTKRQFASQVVRIYGREHGLSEGLGNLTIGSDGTVYARSGGTVIRLEPGVERWQGVFPGAKHLEGMWVRDLLVDSTGRLYAATNEGLKYADGDTMLTEQSGQWFGEVGQALGQGVFAAGWDVPLLRFDGQRWTPVDLFGAGKQEGPQRRMVSLDGCSRYLWVGTWGTGLYRFDGRQWERFTSRDVLGDNHCERLVAADGKVLVYYDLNGVDWYDGRRWRYFNDQNGLLDPAVQAMAIDRQGRPWVATEERSLGCLTDQGWATALTNKPIQSMAVHPDGTLWLADDGGQVTVLQVK